MTALGKTLFSFLMIGGGFGLASLVGPPEAVQQLAERLTPHQAKYQQGQLQPADRAAGGGNDWAYFAQSQVNHLGLVGESQASGVTPLPVEENVWLAPTPQEFAPQEYAQQSPPALDINAPSAQSAGGWNLFAAQTKQSSGQLVPQQPVDQQPMQWQQGQVVPAQGIMPIEQHSAGHSEVQPATTGWRGEGWRKESRTQQLKSPQGWQDTLQPDRHSASFRQPRQPSRPSGPPPAGAWQGAALSGTNVAARTPPSAARAETPSNSWDASTQSVGPWQQPAVVTGQAPASGQSFPAAGQTQVSSPQTNVDQFSQSTNDWQQQANTAESFLPWNSGAASATNVSSTTPNPLPPESQQSQDNWSDFAPIGQQAAEQPQNLNAGRSQRYGTTEPSVARHHLVADGDTLQRIAERYLGDPGRALELFAWNRDVLSNPDLLPIGAEIRVTAPKGQLQGFPVPGNTSSVSFGSVSFGTGPSPAAIGGMVPAASGQPHATQAPRAQLLGPQPAMSTGTFAGW